MSSGKTGLSSRGDKSTKAGSIELTNRSGPKLFVLKKNYSINEEKLGAGKFANVIRQASIYNKDKDKHGEFDKTKTI